MALDIITASTDRDLTSTSDLKALVLGATATSTSADAYMSNLIRRGSRWAGSFIGQDELTVQTYRETVPGYGSRRLMLSRTPLRAIKAVYDATDTGTADQLETTDFIVEDREAGLLAIDEGFPWTAPLQWRGAAALYGDAIPLDPSPLSGQEYRPYLVDYVAGWTYGGIDTGSSNWSTIAGTTSTGRTLPEDIEAGVLQRSQAFYQNRDGIAEESLGDVSVKYNARSGGVDSPYSWEELLEPYRRIGP